jgi:hypothetical protein
VTLPWLVGRADLSRTEESLRLTTTAEVEPPSEQVERIIGA